MLIDIKDLSGQDNFAETQEILELTEQHAMAYNLQKEILGKPVEMQGRKVRSLK